ncbi:MAG: 3-hydroxyacyl-CoA dehydrogenase NAD-binding domain-containing protein [Planctomycetota bacterium]|nr:3-hydroxyacyl-CoA dehydrogenase NAD-binding domain-containing protein [Planctomycetota bacterium]MDA1137634.1 3-hydroxyacyl-CoA dehydrogenase NAD-binding domain-containing protein [Planctomycetota bacterium]
MSDMKQIAILGAGTVGSSWASLFVAHGLSVRFFDAHEQTQSEAWKHIRANAAFLAKEGLADSSDYERGINALAAASSIEELVCDADFIQESVTESYDVKKAILGPTSEASRPDAIIASSSSGLLMTEVQKAIKHPERSVIAHPFNPPHLVPLVELVPGEQTSEQTVQAARVFFESIGKVPVVLNKEVPGHIANRLSAALWREAIDLVASGVASVEEVDKALHAGPGLRWAILGQHMIYHLGGGEGGYLNFIDHIGSTFSEYWKTMPTWTEIPEEVKEQIVRGVVEAQGERTLAEVSQWRDDKLVKLVKAVYGE